MEICVARLPESQIENAASLLARAFHDQPFERFYEPDAERRTRLLREVYLRLVRYCFACGEPYVTGDELAGVALWMPPHATHMTPEQEREFGLDRSHEIFGETAFARSRPLLDLLNERHERDMKETHWYLPILGVDPSRQGTGVGGALLRAGFALSSRAWRLDPWLAAHQKAAGQICWSVPRKML